MARIQVIQYEEAEGALKEIYDELIAKRGNLSEVLKIKAFILLLLEAIRLCTWTSCFLKLP
jgi:hypothetical protein